MPSVKVLSGWLIVKEPKGVKTPLLIHLFPEMRFAVVSAMAQGVPCMPERRRLMLRRRLLP